jgi:T-complex protein 1 subunit alpha
VTAVCAVANIVKSSLGPQGLDKMIVDDVGEVLITNDGATILKRIEVEHPAAKVLVQLSQLQDAEVGDGTTSVVIIAAELLKKANEMIRNKVHPTNIINGYKMAAREACRYIEEKLSFDVGELGENNLVNAVMTSMSSKLIGTEKEFYAKMVVEAVQAIRVQTSQGGRFPVKAINIVKSHGKSSLESRLIKGYAVQAMKSHQLMPSKITKARIAILDMNLQKFRLQMGVQVLVDDPKNLDKIRKNECDVLKHRIEKILAAGANVVITTMGLD